MKLTLAWLLLSGPGTVQADISLPGDALFRLACQACHALGSDTHDKIGPKLKEIAGKRAGTATAYPYSEALKGSGMVWNQPTLVAWIAGAERIVPGTLMAHHNTLTPAELMTLSKHLLGNTESSLPP